MIPENLYDYVAESSLLSIVLHNGKNSYIDVNHIVNENSFHLYFNSILWNVISHVFENEQVQHLDLNLLKSKIKDLGFKEALENKKNLEYLELLSKKRVNKDNILSFALQVKKYSIFRRVYDQYSNTLAYLESIDGKVPLSDVVDKCESNVTTALSDFDDRETSLIWDGADERLVELLESDIIDQVGIPTGFSRWDRAIGGGLRNGTVNVIAARPKSGKSTMVLNMARNIAKIDIPTLVLDTEMTKGYQMDKLICIDSECPINSWETGKFKQNKDLVQKVRTSIKHMQSLPFYYKSVGGMSYQEILSIARRWIVKHVGFDDSGKANPCVIFYDYFKLTGVTDASRNTAEFIQLGDMLSRIHDFTLEYNIPMVGMVQMNRSGIENDETDAVAGSDRILWLCSSLSYFRNKSEDDIAMGCGYEFGNKKLKPIETRYGPGLVKDSDYINIKASIKPNVAEHEATGRMEEGATYYEVYAKQNNIS